MAMGPTLEPRSGERYGLASRGWTAPRVLLAVQRAYLLPHRCAGPYRRSSQKRVLYSQKLKNNAPFQVDFLKSGHLFWKSKSKRGPVRDAHPAPSSALHAVVGIPMA